MLRSEGWTDNPANQVLTRVGTCQDLLNILVPFKRTGFLSASVRELCGAGFVLGRRIHSAAQDSTLALHSLVDSVCVCGESLLRRCTSPRDAVADASAGMP